MPPEPAPHMPVPLLEWLEKQFPAAKRTTLRRMVESRRVLINGRPARSAKAEVVGSDDVRVVGQATGRRAASKPLPFKIVHEDQDIIVIDKPPGLLTSTVPREPRPTAWAMVGQYVAGHEPRARVGLIHRLDRDASGLLIFSKNRGTYDSLKSQFFRHTVERVYLAVTKGVPNPPSGRIESRLMELPDGRVVTVRKSGKGQRAVTDYEVLARARGLALVRVRLETGRKHQIRSQLAQRGTPVVNDPLYGEDETTGRLMLVATELSIDHPSNGKRIRFGIVAPAEMLRLMGR